MFQRPKKEWLRSPEPLTEPGPEPRPTVTLPADTLVDQDALVAGELLVKSRVDEAYEQFEKSGAHRQLPGFGKPLTVPTDDVLTSVMKHAGVTHPWVMLRRLIQEMLEEIIALMDRRPDDPDIDEQLGEVNKKIVAMNLDAPGLALHRRKITRDNIREQFAKWK